MGSMLTGGTEVPTNIFNVTLESCALKYEEFVYETPGELIF